MSRQRRPAWVVLEAHHEAGHAVIATALGVEVVSVTIDGVQSHVRYRHPTEDLVRDHLGWLETMAVVTAAAKFAEEGWYPTVAAGRRKKYTRYQEREEGRRVAESVEILALADGDPEAVRCRVEERARALVEEHETEIAAVADVLLERWTITGDELREILGKDD